MMGAGLEVFWLRLKRERAIASLSEQVSAPGLARCLQSDRQGRAGGVGTAGSGGSESAGR